MGETESKAPDPNQVSAIPSSVVPPRRSEAAEPDYPPQLRSAGVEGEVGLEVQVNAEGNVSEVKVVRPAPQAAFNDAAVESARRSRYEPARLNGTAVSYVIQFTVRFRLRRGEVSP